MDTFKKKKNWRPRLLCTYYKFIRYYCTTQRVLNQVVWYKTKTHAKNNQWWLIIWDATIPPSGSHVLSSTSFLTWKCEHSGGIVPSHILAHGWLFLIINYFVLLLTLSHPYSHMSFVGGILFHIYPNISLCWALRHPYPMCVHGSLQLCYHHPSMSFWCIFAIPIRICVFVWLSTFLIAFCLLLELSNTLLTFMELNIIIIIKWEFDLSVPSYFVGNYVIHIPYTPFVGFLCQFVSNRKVWTRKL